MKPAWTAWVLLAGAMLSAGGCASGPLTIDVIALGETVSLHYHLNPGGRLTVNAEAEFRTESDKPEFETQLDKKAMDSLRSVIYTSGFFLAETPTGPGDMTGLILRVAITLGLWDNTMDIRGQRVYSVRKILTELDTHLPNKYKIHYQSATGGAEPMPVPPEDEFLNFP